VQIKKLCDPNVFRTIGQEMTCAPCHKKVANGLLTAGFRNVCFIKIILPPWGKVTSRDWRLFLTFRPGCRAAAVVRARGLEALYEGTPMDKLSCHLHIRLTEGEQTRLQSLMQTLGADRSSITRLAIKRLFRSPPQRKFRFRLKRGAKL